MGDQDNKRKKSHYFAPKKRRQYNLEPGQKGFLCFCNFREKDCVREAMNLLNEYLTSKNKPDATQQTSNDSDIEDELSKEIEEMKKATSNERQFQVVESGAKNVIFIRSTIDNTVELANAIVKDVYDTKEQKTRFLLRLVPIECTCRANLVDIKENIITLIDKYFSGEPKSFSVVYNHRNNSNLDRDEVIKEIAALVGVKNEKHIVSLKEPELAIIVEVIRGICLLSVVPDYVKFKKYNLHQLCEKKSVKMNVSDESRDDGVENKAENVQKNEEVEKNEDIKKNEENAEKEEDN